MIVPMGTWPVAADGALDALIADRPDLGDRYAVLTGGVWDAGVPAHLLELCRIRMAQLLGDAAGAALRSPQAAGLDEARVAALGRWWDDPGFDPLARAALAVAEQFTIDVHGVTDDQFAAVRDALDPAAAVAFAFALALFDGQSRLRLAFATPSDRSAP